MTIFDFSTKEWTCEQYLRVLQNFDGKNINKNDLESAYISFFNHTGLLYYEVLEKFFRLGLDPNTKFSNGKTLLEFACSNSPTHTKEVILRYINILDSTGLITPETYMQACMLYIQNYKEKIEPSVVEKPTELSKPKQVEPKKETIPDKNREHTSKNKEESTHKRSAVNQPELIPIKLYHFLIPGAYRKVSATNQLRLELYYQSLTNFSSSTAMMMSAMPMDGMPTDNNALSIYPSPAYSIIYDDGKVKNLETNSNGNNYQH